MKARLLLTTLLVAAAANAAPQNTLDAGFQSPPDSAKPHTWWHWMMGNVTKEGITADLEAMKRAGVGGAQIFSVSEAIPVGQVKFMSPEFRGLVKHAVTEADRLGLELCMHNCAGWSSSGGPWNTPANAMQFVTTSEKQVIGPATLNEALPQPNTRLNYYQDIAILAFPTPAKDFRIADLGRKAAFERGDNIEPATGPEAPADSIIARDKIVDLTAQFKDGKLSWNAPAGNWTILRIGHTPTGAVNSPAPDDARGPEVDKLSKTALDAHWAGMMKPLLDDIGPLAGKTLNNSLIDSYEVGNQNWTPLFRQEFQKRRGYDILPYLPVFTGRVVDSVAVSERVLWDIRRTVADLMDENYYGHFAELCHARGLKMSTEPYGNGPFEDLTAGSAADIPMGEFWIGGGAAGSTKLAASVAHVYGKKLVGAESFTAAPDQGKWTNDPYSMKALGDAVFCMGVNRYIFHRYAHQPWLNRAPGMTMGQWGIHFERTNTLWEPQAEWLRYVARCEYLLQQGNFVGDALYFTGENAPDSPRGPDGLPKGYDYDGITADGLFKRISVKNNRLITPDGTSYRVLILPASQTMTPTLLSKLRDLIKAGATVIGPKPMRSPSLQNFPACDAEVEKLATEIWGNTDGKNIVVHELGKGRLIWGRSLEKVFASLKASPDFESAQKGARMTYIHRVAGGSDIYFVSNQSRSALETECTFRISGREPELFHPDSGKTEAAPIYREENGRTVVTLRFDPAGSVFVIFRKATPRDHFVSLKQVVMAPTTAGPISALPTPKLEILNAMYEAVDGAGGADVTDKVRAEVDGAHLKVDATNGNFDDPTEGHAKHLRVQYVLNGKLGEMSVDENATLEIGVEGGERTPKLKIVKAMYEAVDGAGGADVTDKVRAAVDGAYLMIDVTNENFGDPINLHVKHLRVQYILNGKPGEIAVGENATLELGAADKNSIPAYEWTSDNAGRAQIIAWQPGTFSLQTAQNKIVQTAVLQTAEPQEIGGAWDVIFPPNWGAPPKITLDKLISWPEHADSGVKYFSGTATYSKDFNVPANWLAPNKALFLDLGRVKDLARVKLNGQDLGVLWKPPYRVDIGGAAKAGANHLEIEVTNGWPNRLIGDEQLPDDREWDGMHLKAWPHWVLDGKPSPTGRFTFTTWHHWRKDSPLQESGLLGPVTLRAGAKLAVK